MLSIGEALRLSINGKIVPLFSDQTGLPVLQGRQSPPSRISAVRNDRTLLVFAWAIEIAGVCFGLLNAGYTTFGDEWPNTAWGYVPAAPMIVMALAELGRVPFVSVFFYKRIAAQCLATLSILVLSYLAMENWTIGFERVFDLRTSAITKLMSEVARAESDKSAAESEETESIDSNEKKRIELRASIKSREDSIAALGNQLTAASKTHHDNLEKIGDKCRMVQGPCIKPRSEIEDGRYIAEVRQLTDAKNSEQENKQALENEIKILIKADAKDAAAGLQKKSTATADLNTKRQELRQAAGASSIHRLVASWFGTANLTPEQFATARWWFATMGAIAVAVIGSAAAFVHFSPDRIHGSPSFLERQADRVARARRKYYARKRRPLVVEVPVYKEGKEYIYKEGKETVVKEVERKTVRILAIPTSGSNRAFWLDPSDRRETIAPDRERSGSRAFDTLSNVVPLDKEKTGC